MHPGGEPRRPYVQTELEGAPGPFVAVSDWMRAVPDVLSRWVPGDYTSLGTDGFGRSDTRQAVRSFFEVDAPHLVVAVLASLAAQGEVKHELVAEAIAAHGIDPDVAPPWTR